MLGTSVVVKTTSMPSCHISFSLVCAQRVLKARDFKHQETSSNIETYIAFITFITKKHTSLVISHVKAFWERHGPLVAMFIMFKATLIFSNYGLAVEKVMF